MPKLVVKLPFDKRNTRLSVQTASKSSSKSQEAASSKERSRKYRHKLKNDPKLKSKLEEVRRSKHSLIKYPPLYDFMHNV